ncbi:GNAT family N-acetyltransferase [Tessaracoccus oleiagri]|uniref:Protein N-acetyltransferase, RimJ/RimL family n=1 Tax=Tessaracoccus oleiagri TaxID=686624 RepID=A0A1G9HDW8_9ACTN|nr:GNAT family N-acetyltransferase [Tessaracoccus oleiagri]SDL11221.1 Protein N-acetyltransferase, RimJ/RimL family [Tessaracoccus oleiagri]
MLRPARDEDLDAMRAWRNHDEVRRVSLTQHVITPEEHVGWWERTKVDPTREVLIYERDGLPSGVVTFFDIEDGKAWWGYYLDNAGLEERGAMFPAWISIQREAVKYARDVLGLTQLDGETLASNASAVDFNSRQGFVEVERYPREVGGATIEVIHSRKIFEGK